MAIGLSTIIRTARAQVIIDAIDVDTAPGYVEFYNGVRPATGEAVTTQTLLGTVTLGSPSGTASNGTLTLTSTTDDLSVDDDGTLTWCRVFDGAGGFIMDMTCGLAGSGATVIFNSTTALAGGILKINSGTFVESNA